LESSAWATTRAAALLGKLPQRGSARSRRHLVQNSSTAASLLLLADGSPAMPVRPSLTMSAAMDPASKALNAGLAYLPVSPCWEAGRKEMLPNSVESGQEELSRVVSRSIRARGRTRPPDEKLIDSWTSSPRRSSRGRGRDACGFRSTVPGLPTSRARVEGVSWLDIRSDSQGGSIFRTGISNSAPPSPGVSS